VQPVRPHAVTLAEERTVWIIDDSPLDAERARRALAEHYTVRIFWDGSAALEALAADPPPDVLILDWMMPGVSGIDVCRFIRAGSPSLARISVLLLTARQQTEQVVEGLSAGANDYLSKPYADEELRARVDALVRSLRLLERAEHAEATVKSLLANVPDTLLVLLPNGRLTYANPEATRALGRPLESLLGQRITDIVPELSMELVTAASLSETSLPLPDVTLGDATYAPTVRAFHSGRPRRGGSIFTRSSRTTCARPSAPC
jgi:DNA-binding response OmpR family regulator